MAAIKIIQFSRPPTPHLRTKFFHPVHLGRPISNERPLPRPHLPLPLPMITNKLKENKLQGWILYVGPYLRSAFVFIINSLILSDFLLTSFHLAEASLSAFLWLYTLGCAFVQKYHEMFFIYNYWHYDYWFCNQPVFISQLENVNKLWNNNSTVHVN